MGDENFMATFITGLVILLLGGWLYGKFVEHVFKPDDRETPAVRMKDGIDYVPMNKWKNALINLLNIAGVRFLGRFRGSCLDQSHLLPFQSDV